MNNTHIWDQPRRKPTLLRQIGNGLLFVAFYLFLFTLGVMVGVGLMT